MTQVQHTIRFPAADGGQNYGRLDVDAVPLKGSDVVTLEQLTGPQLVELHNLVVSNLGGRATNKFSDNRKAVERTWKALTEYAALVEAENHNETGEEPRDAAGFEMSSEELAAQKPREVARAAFKASLPEPNPAAAAQLSSAILSPIDKAHVAEEAVARKANREPQAGAIRKPRAPKVDDGSIRMPTEGGKQRAKKQKDGSYAFRIPAGKPRTETISDQREELLGHLVEGSASWASIKALFGKDDFRTVTTVTMFCITLGYGLETQPDGTIKLLEPVA